MKLKSSPRLFQNVQNAHPQRAKFDLSYSKLFTCDMGQLIPIMCEEMIPGDKFTVGNEIVIRMQPLVAPVLHEINVFTHYFFVPTRIIWEDWEEFITRGVTGDVAVTLPTWDPSTTENLKKSLWDYLGLPVGIRPLGALPLDFPKRCYNAIWNQYYRDETLQTEIDIEDNFDILLRNWDKDYFTSALPWSQRGTPPAIAFSGTTSAEWTSGTWDLALYLNGRSNEALSGQRTSPSSNIQVSTPTQTDSYGPQQIAAGLPVSLLNNNVVDLDQIGTVTASDLRLLFQIQKWQERNARGGIRYNEFLQNHYNVHPRDDRLQRPEYIGGSKSPMLISEVLQTSSTDAVSPQGNMSGHGISASSQFCGKYYAQEFGYLVGIMSIMPRPMYSQGINRQWLRRTAYDFPFPEFVNLSEQAIEQAELYATGVSEDNTVIFGYQGRYDELRYKPNMVCADMVDDFDFWHLGRQFSTAPALNSEFLACVPDKRIFATPSEDGFIVNVGNLITAVRPIPQMGTPGLLDHN
ncbi:MAG: major capsid protein [Arizlama microvirus]|nr:MAG: major capsid protein [Arizlama microvirus]